MAIRQQKELPNKAVRCWFERTRVSYLLEFWMNSAKSAFRVWDAKCRGSSLPAVWVSEVFVWLTQIPLLVSMETV